MESKEYFVKELGFTEAQLEKLYNLYKEKSVLRGGLCPMRVFQIEYQYTSIGLAKILVINNERIPINDDEWDNV